MNLQKSLLIVALLTVAVASQAQTLFSTGFEAPTYTASAGNGTNLAGQDGWFGRTSALAADANFKFGVSGEFTNGGTQGVRVDTSPLTTGSMLRTLNYDATTTANKILRLKVDVAPRARVLSTDPTDTSGYGIILVGRNGSSLVQMARLEVYAADPNFPAFVSFGTRVGGTFGFAPDSTANIALPTNDTWMTLELAVDYNTNTVSAFINGVNYGVTRGLDTLTTAGSIQAIEGGLYMNAFGNDRGYYDNFSITAVPEPMTLGLLGLGAAALVRRRKARKS